MPEFARRDPLEALSAAAADLNYARGRAAEPGILRGIRFVRGGADPFVADTRKCAKVIGVVGVIGVGARVDSESLEDIRPQAGLAASAGSVCVDSRVWGGYA